MKTLIACLIVVPVLLSGCAANQSTSQQSTVDIRVVFRTDYEGAKLVSKNKISCTTPCTYIYRNLNPRNDVMVDDALSYQWDSGATLAQRLVIRKSDFVKFDGDFSATVKRPTNYPNVGLDQDKHNQVLAQQQRLAEQKSAERRADQLQAAAPQAAEPQSEGSALLGILNILAGAYNDAAAERKRNAPVNCTTTLIGIIATTTCR